MAEPPLALVLYRWRTQWPMRRWERERIRAWRHFPGRVAFFNLGFRFDPAWLSALDPQVVVYDATALALRYQPLGWETVARAAEALSAVKAVRVAMPLDEFRGLEPLRAFVRDARIDLVLSAADPGVAAALYPDAPGRVRRILTAYVDEGLEAAGRRVRRAGGRRPLVLGYRLWGAETGLGRLGDVKREIGLRAEAWAKARGVRHDIAVDGSRVLAGEAWLRFLARCRATVGAEGGATVRDPATGQPLDIAALSPRHLEAAALGVFQVLAAGDYSGVLKPGVHYAPVAADLSDLDATLDLALDVGQAQAVAARAYDELIASGAYSWRRLIASLGEDLLG